MVTAAAIRQAGEHVPAEFRGSSQFVSDELSEHAGRPVVVKVDAVNPVGAFKGRGAWLAVAQLVREGSVDSRTGVVVASTGNFGQAVAYAGRALGIPVTVFAETSANPRKVAGIRRLGAAVRLEGHDFDAARESAARHAQAGLGRLLVDGVDPWIAIGAGTLAVEVSDAIAHAELPPLAAAFIPVGNGALIAGVGTWLREVSPSTRVVGVQSEAAPSMTLSWRAGRPIETETAATRAGGIATRVPVPEALEVMQRVVDDMVLVSEKAIDDAASLLTRALGVTVELAAGASWAGLAAAPPPGEGAALILITGTNAERAASDDGR
jgi:threonine dehydratase